MIPLQLKREKIVFSVLQMPLRIGCDQLRELARISNLLDVLDGIDKLLARPLTPGYLFSKTGKIFAALIWARVP
jgi:hypothetical protein